MSRIQASVETVKKDFPEGVSTQGLLRFQLVDTTGAVVQSQDVDGVEYIFPGVADGSYSVTAQRLDASGNPFGDVASASATVGSTAPVSTQYDSPSSLTVTVLADA